MLGRKSFLHFLGGMIAWGLSFVCLVITTNYIGMDNYGTIITFISIFTIINVLADLGFSNAHIKRISEGKDLDDCYSSYLIIKINLTCLFIIVSFISLLIWTYVLGNTVTPAAMSIFLILLAYEILLTLANIVGNTFLGTTQIAYYQVLILLNPLARLPLLLALAYLGTDEVGLAITYMLGTAVMAVGALLMIRRVKFRWKEPTLIRSYIDFSWVLIPMAILTVVGANIDKVIIGLDGTSVDVGSFSTAQTLMAMVTTIGSAIAALTFPDFSRLFKEGRGGEVRDKSKTGERLISLVTTPITVVLILYPDAVLTTLFGAQGQGSGETLRILAIATLILIVNTVHISQVLAADRPKQMSRINIISVLVLIALLIVLIPGELLGMKMLGMGMVGAGWAWMASYLVLVVLARVEAYNICKAPFNWRMSLHLLGAIVAGFLVWELFILIPISGLVLLAAAVVTTYLIFFAVMAGLKELKGTDVRYILDIVNPKEMLKYIGSEVRKK